MKKTAVLIAALLAPFAIPAASAATGTTATTNWSQLKFNVIDLTPDDGIAAGFALTSAYSQVHMDFHDSAGKYVGLSREYAGIAHETVSLTHEGKVLSVSATDTSSTISAVIPSLYAPRGEATVASTSGWRFTLAPNSLLVLTGEATLDVGISSNYPDRLRASAEFSGDGKLDGAYTEFAHFRTTQWGHDGDYTTSFGLSLANASDESQQGWFTLSSVNFGRVFEQVPPPPVPEPATYMMLLAGLAATVAAARRRNKKA